jgi:hypothetical protein
MEIARPKDKTTIIFLINDGHQVSFGGSDAHYVFSVGIAYTFF